MFRSKYNYFKEYARATEKTLLSSDELKGALELEGNFDKTCYIENLGQGKFKLNELPFDVQVAPVTDVVVTDLNTDGKPDIICVGNNFGNETFIGRQDGFNGAILKGNGSGHFSATPTYESGFMVPGDAKSILEIKDINGKPLFIVTQNRGRLLVFQN